MNQNRFFIGLTIVVAIFAVTTKLFFHQAPEVSPAVVAQVAPVVEQEVIAASSSLVEGVETTTLEAATVLSVSSAKEVAVPRDAIELEPVPVPALPTFTNATLSQYNGEDLELPIYLALEGVVYDITAGKEYYAPGGKYHFLAGKDGTVLLKHFGGDLIKQKYPVVGTYREQ